MSYTELFKNQCKILNTEFEVLPLEFYLLSGVILPYSFIEDETRDYVGLQVTQEDGTEHYTVVPKNNIEMVKIMYDSPLEDDDETDNINKRLYG